MSDQPRRSSQQVSTSLSSPLQAPSIPLPAGIPGRLRITFAPGKHGPAELSSAIHERDLNLDLLSLLELKTDVLAGFTEAAEMEKLSVPLADLQAEVERLGMTYLHHSLPDRSAPRGEKDSQAALEFARQLAVRVQQGETVTVYCRGGLGRSGMMAAVVLTLLSEDADQAIEAVRAVRKGAIQTDAQEAFVRTATGHVMGSSHAPLNEAPAGRLRILLGLVAADALGAATEFQSPDQIAKRFPQGLKTYASGSPFGFLPGESTDDSQMTLATLCGLRGGTKDAEEVLRHYLDWLKHRPPDVGNLTRNALSLARQGEGQRAGMLSWVESGMDNAGNGGLMRVAGVYLAGLTSTELTNMAVQVTALTHADPRCVLASVFMVKLLEQLEHFKGAYGDAVLTAWKETEAGVSTIVSALEAQHCFENRTLTRRVYTERLQQTLPEVKNRVLSGLGGQAVGQSGYVLDTLQAALALQQNAESWLEVAEAAALAGDDSDTVACVAGAIAGARGFDVPPHLLPDLRVGASWGDWQRDWSSMRLAELL
jgi:ADP-ribosyl-[dinitrogen reductase] hydrolase